MKPPCPHHKPLGLAGFFKYKDKADKYLEQRQCPTCLRWYFHGEFWKGWKKGIKFETSLKS
jgi:hypothetical protein